MRTLYGISAFLVLASVSSATIIDDIFNVNSGPVTLTRSFLDIPDNLNEIVPLDEFYSVEQVDTFDREITLTVSGGTGEGVLMFAAEVIGHDIFSPPGFEYYGGYSKIEAPFLLEMYTAPWGDLYTNSCYGVLCGPVAFTYGVPVTFTIRASSTSYYAWLNNGILPALLPGSPEEALILTSESTLDLIDIANVVGFNVYESNPNARITIQEVHAPEPGTWTVAGGLAIWWGLRLLQRRSSRSIH